MSRFLPFFTVSTRFNAVFDPFLARFFTVSDRLFSPSLREEIFAENGERSRIR
jgi:hypothetical protein